MTFTSRLIFLKNPASVLPGPISTKVVTPFAIIRSMLCCQRTEDATCSFKRFLVSPISFTYSAVTLVT